jgi:hypothetical protein
VKKMKKAKTVLSEAELQREYPLANLAEGWFFRCEETSAGCYQVEGMDLCDRIVSMTGFDHEALFRGASQTQKRLTQKPK